MVAIDIKTGKMFGCFDEKMEYIILCKGCEYEETCDKDREEPARWFNCPEPSNQLEFDFPN